jgi:hypothetical protein
MRQMCFVVLIGSMLVLPGSSVRVATMGRPLPGTRTVATAPPLPLMFEPGGTNEDFRARGRGYDIAVSRYGVAVRPRDDRGAPAIELRFGGSAAELRPEQALTTRVNYLRGSRDGWRMGVPTYAAVRATNVYPGIDAVFYGTEGDLEYDLVVASGASPNSIRLSFVGSDRVQTRDGELHVRAQDRTLIQRRPVAYQDIHGRRVPVDVRYRILGRDVGFAVGRYDRTRPLVIDPILSYSTYFGATGPDVALGVAVDAAGNAYVVGVAEAGDLPGPTARPHTPLRGGSGGYDRDAYVAKFRPNGTVEWISYIGGTDWDIASAVAVGPDGDAYVAGETHSSDFPTTAGAYHPEAPSHSEDEFVVRLAPDGTSLRYSTLLGAPQPRWNGAIDAIVVDPQGRAYIAGTTGSPDFPVTVPDSRGAESPGIDNTDAFVARFSADGSRLEFARLLAGSLNERAAALTLDPSGSVYVVGTTWSLDYPVLNALYPAHFGPTDPDGEYGADGFLSCVDKDGNLVFSTYLGGTGEDFMTSVVRARYDRIYVGGATTSEGLAFYHPKPSPPGLRSGILYEIVPNGSSLVNARYIGGSGDTVIEAMAVTSDTNWIWILGGTDGAGWKYWGYPDPVTQGSSGGGADLFLQKWSASLDTLNYSDLLGGAGNEVPSDIALNPTGDLHLVGYTTSANYPLKNPVQTSLKPNGADIRPPMDGIVTKFACNVYQLGPVPMQPAEGGNGKTWTMNEAGCVLSAVSDAPWLHVTGYESHAVTFSVDPNPTASPRAGHLLISGRATATVTQAAGSGPPQGAPEVVLNAGDASLVRGTWTLAPDAVHGQVLTQPDAGAPKIGTASADPANYFEFTFNADAGRPYHLWIHGRAQNDSWQNDSAYVQFSDSVDEGGNPIFRIGTTSATWVSLEECSGCGEQGWGWQDNAYGAPGNLGPDIRFATSGPHTIRVQQREDGFDIGQIVLSAETYLTTAPGAAKNDPTVVRSHDEIVIHTSASSQSVNGTWRFRSDATAAGSTTLWNADAGAPKLASPLAAPANYFDITFNADAGKPYHLWLRMKADNDDWRNDSVWIQFSESVDESGNPTNRIGTTSGTWVSLEECSGCGEQGWGWQDNAYGSPGDLGAPIHFARSGPQTIRVQVREDGLSVDQIVLSTGRYATSPPGAAKNDRTILPRTIQR